MKKGDFKIFKNIPTLTTERLMLRKIQKDDLEDVFEYTSDPDVSEFLTWHPHENIEYTKSYIRYLQILYRRGKFFDWAVVKDGKMIGTVGFSKINLKENFAEIGYVLNREFWGMGIAVEAINEILRFGFSVLNFDKISAVIIRENIGSARVLEKSHFVNENSFSDTMLIKGVEKNIKRFSITKEFYFSNKA